MRAHVLASLSVVALATVSVHAQTKPDFTGTWALVKPAPEQPSIASAGDASFVAGSMGSGWGSPITIRQETNRLILEYAHFSAYDLQPLLRLVYALDGSDSSNSLMIGHAESTQHSRAAWQGNTLLITTRFQVPGDNERIEVRQAITLESGQMLAIETTRSGLPGAAPSVTRTLYARR